MVAQLSDNDVGISRKDPTLPGEYRPGWEEVMRMVDAREVDVVYVWKWDRGLREPLDLEYAIPRFDKAGVRFAEADGSIDLGTESGRLHARIMIAVAKNEVERKAERQKLANQAAARDGKRFTAGPRPFGYSDDHVTPHPAEGPAVADACAMLLAAAPSAASCANGPRPACCHRSRAPGKPAAGASPTGSSAAPGTTAGVRSARLDPKQHPHHPAEPRDRRPVFVSRRHRGHRELGTPGPRGNLACRARHPGRPGPLAAARGPHPSRRPRAVPVQQHHRRQPLPHRPPNVPLLLAHPGPDPARPARRPDRLFADRWCERPADAAS